MQSWRSCPQDLRIGETAGCAKIEHATNGVYGYTLAASQNTLALEFVNTLGLGPAAFCKVLKEPWS